MISKSGRYWSTGITVTYVPLAGHFDDEPYGGWYASLNYSDDGHSGSDPDAEQISTGGTLCTRCPARDGELRSGLSLAVDTLIADAKRFGIDLISTRPYAQPWLFYKGDGESAEYPPPDGWHDLLVTEARRAGLRTYDIPG